MGSPPLAVHTALHPYLRGAVELRDLPFNFSTSEGERDYDALIRSLVKDLTTGNLAGHTKFAVFITTYADPERGGLHCAPSNEASLPVSDMLELLLPASVINIMQGRNTGFNTLTFLVCGAMALKAESRSAVQKFVTSGPFAWAMAFSQGRFLPSVGNAFLADVAVQWHVQGRHPKLTLDNHQVMGAHSDIHLFHPNRKSERLLWSHPVRCPFGKPSLTQCPNKECGAIRPWGEPTQKSLDGEVVRYTLRCQACTLGMRFRKPVGMKLIKGTKPTKSELGDWYAQDL